jgi:hypothetical protein
MIARLHRTADKTQIFEAWHSRHTKICPTSAARMPKLGLGAGMAIASATGRYGRINNMPRSFGFLTVSCVSVLLAACSSRQAVDNGDDGGATDLIARSDATQSDATPSDRGGTTECLIANKKTACCNAEFQPATRQEILADPCLTHPDVAEPNKTCAPPPVTDCPPTCPRRPPTFATKKTAKGSCSYESDCQTGSDCMVALDCETNCCCPTPYPSAIVAQKRCVFASEADRKQNPSCPGPCPGLCPQPSVEASRCGSAKGDGAPAGVRSCQQKLQSYILWQAPGGYAGQGPAVEILADGTVRLWDQISEQQAGKTAGWKKELKLSDQVQQLFFLLDSIKTRDLPHKGSSGGECYPMLVYRPCANCAKQTIRYNVPADLLPEMQPVYNWFKDVLAKEVGSSTELPPSYCPF